MKKICLIFIVLRISALYAQGSADQSVSTTAARIDFINGAMESERFHATFWSAGWAVFNGGSAAYFFYRGENTKNKADKVNNMVIGAGSALACFGNIVTPMVSMYAPHFLDNMPENTSDERSTKLSKAEQYLDYGSSLESFGRSWISHTINFATSTIGALVVGVGYRNTMKEYGKNPDKEAFILFLECFLSGEIQIFTQPMKMVSARKEYLNTYKTADSTRSNQVQVFLLPRYKGFSAGVASLF